MRTFIAIELPEQAKKSLSLLQEQLKKSSADVKWVEPQNIHLTLKFLGEIEENKCSDITQAIEAIAAKTGPFSIRLSSVGAFPKINFPRVIWVGMDKGDLETKEIACGLEEKLSKIGFPKEDRPFSSHITIGRVRSPLNRDKLVNALGKPAYNFPDEFPVERITFFKSTLTPKGPVYEGLKEISLKERTEG